MTIYAFTSIAVNYIPKARVLARSLKRLHPEIEFSLLLAEPIPADTELDCADFDRVVSVETLGINSLKSWMFKHSLVEACTAIKAFYLSQLLEREDCEAVFYFDPDMAVFAPLTPLLSLLPQSSVLLTPHLLDPEESIAAVADNELSALKHGVYNLGFLGVNNTPEGRRFARWWRERLEHFCFDDIPSGIFTDQRWIDLAPAFFNDVTIVKDPGCNVATWNLTHRVVHGDFATGFYVNDAPLIFYHFSGFDSGNQLLMLQKYGKQMPALYALRQWYVKEGERLDAPHLAGMPWLYGQYDNGESITKEHRQVYKSREDLQNRYPDPFLASAPETPSKHPQSFLEWFKRHGTPKADQVSGGVESQRQALNSAEFPAISVSANAASAGTHVDSPDPISLLMQRSIPFEHVGLFPYFDPGYYLDLYAQSMGGDADPIVHFMMKGASELKNPSSLFDTKFYLEKYPQVSASGINPLIHFITQGWEQDCNPNPLFDVRFYLDHNPDVKEAGINPLKHYILFGWREGRNPHPLFDTAFYLSQNPRVLQSGMNPLAYYILNGAAETVSPHPLFDSTLYLARNPDVAESRLNPLLHYCVYGWLEERDPNGWFDCSKYLNASVSARHSRQNPLAHFVERARKSLSRTQLSDVNRVHQYYNSCVLFDARRNHAAVLQLTELSRSKPVVLEIGLPGGGVAKHIEELSRLIQKDVVALVLQPVDDVAGSGWVQLRCPELGPSVTLHFNPQTQIETLVSVLRSANVDRVHLHHVMGCQRFIKELIDRLNVPFDFTVHDYYVLSPNIHLNPEMAGAGSSDAPESVGDIAWRAGNTWLLRSADRVIAPSHDTQRRVQQAFPGTNITLAQHHESGRLDAPVKASRISGDEPLRVLLLGEMLPHKGASILLECADLVRAGTYPISFDLIGYIPNSFVRANDHVLKVHGRYEQNELQRLIHSVDPHLCWFPSQCAETYSYTLSSVLECGLPVVVANIGALPERISHRPWSFVYDCNATPREWIDLFMRLRTEHFATGRAPEPFVSEFETTDASFYQGDYLHWAATAFEVRKAQASNDACDELFGAKDTIADETKADMEAAPIGRVSPDIVPFNREQIFALKLQSAQCDMGEALLEIERLRSRLAAIEGTTTWKARNKLLGIIPK